MRPKPGEKKDDFLKRFSAAFTPLPDGPPVENAALLAWEEATASHAGTSDVCCQGKTLDHFAINLSSYTTQLKKFEGRDHLVVPVVMLTEGVHKGSSGPIYYPAEEIAKFPGAWNGIPVPVYHPEEGGFPISCNSPDVLEKQNVGRVFGAKAVENGKKLKAQIWFDIVRLQEVDPALLVKINAKTPIEVSTGLFMDIDPTPGEWNGEKYELIARNFRPDHLATLPSGVGACSVKDGCGIRANQGAEMNKKQVLEWLVDNANPSFTEVIALIRNIIYAKDKPMAGPGTTSTFHYVREVWSDRFVYEKEQSGQPTKYFQQAYKLNAEKNGVEFEGDPVEVIQSTTYKPIVTKNQGGIDVNKEEKIKYLTANGTPEALAKDATDEVLDYLVKTTQDRVEEKTKMVALEGENNTLKANQQKAPKTAEEFIAQAPPEIQMTLNRAMARDRSRKDELVGMLVKNQTVFTEPELKAMDLEHLEKLGALAAPKDFSLRGPVGDPIQANKEEPMEAPVLFGTK